MRAKALLFACLIVCPSVLAQTMDISVSLNIMPDSRLESKCYIVYDGVTYDTMGKEHPVIFSVHQAIIQVGYGSVGDSDGTGFSPYSHSVTTPSPGTVPNCYRGRATGTPNDTGRSVTADSSDTCFQGPPPPPPTINYCADDYNGENRPDCMSPIVLNLGGGGSYQLSGPDEPVNFDINATGTSVRISWTGRGAAMAFLALDRNGDGVINDGAELFGNHTPLPAGAPAMNGFDALAPYDANHDGVVNPDDPIWSSLVLWTDLNHDGMSQPSEILPLNQSGVAAISLDYHWTGRRDQSGNTFRYESKMWLNNSPRPVYDIFFVAAP